MNNVNMNNVNMNNVNMNNVNMDYKYEDIDNLENTGEKLEDINENIGDYNNKILGLIDVLKFFSGRE